MGNFTVNQGGINTNKEGMPSIDTRYGPYANKQAANDALGVSGKDVIAAGLTVGIIESGGVKEYWYQPNPQNNNALELVEKQAAEITVDTEIKQGGTDPVTGGAIYTALGGKANANETYTKSEVDAKVSSAYKAAGTASSVSNLGSLDASHEGFVYNMSAEFTTTSDFVEGSGKTYPAGTNVAIVNVGTTQNPSYKYDVMAGFVDLSGKADKSEMSVTNWTGANADKVTIQLKSGTSATVLKEHQNIDGKENTSNKVTSFQGTPDDTHYPSEKLVKDSLDLKAPSTNIAKSALASDVQTSLGKADSSVQNITRGGSTLSKTDGVVDIPEEIQTVVATPVASDGSPWATLSNGTLTLGLVSGSDGHNPNLGTFDISDLSNAPAPTKDGDYIVVIDANAVSPRLPKEIYLWDGSQWTATGEAPTATFASGEVVSNVNIVNNPTVGGEHDVASAEALKKVDNKFYSTEDPLVIGIITGKSISSLGTFLNDTPACNVAYFNIEGVNKIKIAIPKVGNSYTANYAYCDFNSQTQTISGLTVPNGGVVVGNSSENYTKEIDLTTDKPTGKQYIALTYIPDNGEPSCYPINEVVRESELHEVEEDITELQGGITTLNGQVTELQDDFSQIGGEYEIDITDSELITTYQGHPARSSGEYMVAGYFRNYIVDLSGLYERGFRKIKFWGVGAYSSNSNIVPGFVTTSTSFSADIPVENIEAIAQTTGTYQLGWYNLPITANSKLLVATLLSNSGIINLPDYGNDGTYVPEKIIAINPDSLNQRINEAFEEIERVDGEIDTVNERIDEVEGKIPGKVTETLSTMSDGNSIALDDYPLSAKHGDNVVFSAKVNSADFNQITIGKGCANTPQYGWLEIDATYVRLYYYRWDSSTLPTPGYNAVLEGTWEHGLTIDKMLNVNIMFDGTIKVTIQTLSGMASHEFTGPLNFYDMYGTIKAISNGSTFTDVKLSATNSYFERPIWIFGASYLTVSSTYPLGALKNIGYFDYYVCARPGAQSTETYPNLSRALALAKPKMLIWAVMSNDVSDSVWEYYAELVATQCETLGIELIYTNLPDMEAKELSTRRQWVIDHGYRYINWLDAVQTSTPGYYPATWYTGFMSSDGIHTTAKGAAAMAMQMIKDVPELMQF